MTQPNDPVFKPGDRVISFRQELATVYSYRVVPYEGKSNRVSVIFDNDTEPSPEYYASVFRALE
jgi:hypothetical protein